jgi:uncharacterized membrane protein YhaH (DUF805 family)
MTVEKNTGSFRVRFGRISYLVLAIIFTICIVVQVFLAGLATFVNPINWANHSALIHAFGFSIPIFMLVFAFVGNMPRFAYWQIFGMLGLVFAMYFTANITSALPWAAAAHPVIAMLLFILSLVIVSKMWRFIFNKKNSKQGEN